MTQELSERSRLLLRDPELRQAGLQRVMDEYPALTPMGFAWRTQTRSIRKGRPSPDEVDQYLGQRTQLLNQVLTQEETGLDVQHQGEIPLALFYLTQCEHSTSRISQSYSIKHRAERIGRPHYISNGAMIAAACMAGAQVVQEETGGIPGVNARLYILEPRRCRCRRTLLPAGIRNRSCSNCPPEPREI